MEVISSEQAISLAGVRKRQLPLTFSPNGEREVGNGLPKARLNGKSVLSSACPKRTAEKLIRSARIKLHAGNRTHAVAKTIRQGLIR